jgi:hypothetical protein
MLCFKTNDTQNTVDESDCQPNNAMIIDVDQLQVLCCM